MPETTIELSITDDFSGKSKTIQNSARALCKSFDELLERQRKLSEKRLTLNADMTQARKELEKAERAYESLGEAISDSEKKARKANYDRLTKELKEVRKEADKTKKEMEGLLSGGTTDKGPSLTDGIEGTTKGAWGTALTVLENDATQVLLNGFGNYIGAKLSSALTTDDATMVTSIASGAMTGALAGSIVPGVGHLVGAIVGGIAGAIGGALTAEAEKFKSEDEFFKEIVEEEFNSALGGIKESVANGRGIAKNRENSSFVFGNLLGSEEKGETFLRSLNQFSTRTPFSFDTLTDTARSLINTGMGEGEIIPMMKTLANAAVATGMSERDMMGALENLAEMKKQTQSGMTNAALLSPLLNNGIDVYGYISDGKNVTRQEAHDTIADYSGEEIAQIVLNGMNMQYQDKLAEWGETTGGLEERVSKLRENLNAAAGEGYNKAHITSLEVEERFYSGEQGKDLEEAYGLMGQYEEKLENGQGTYQRLALRRMLQSDEYAAAKESGDGMKMMELVAQARAEGNTSWYGSKLYQDNMSMEERTLSETRDSVLEIKDTVSKMYEHRQQFTIGQEGAGLNQIKDENSNQSAIQEFQKVSQQYPGRSSQEVAAITKNNLINSHATGLSRVPYDGYKAILHQGEKVIPASKALETERGGGSRFGDIHISVGKVDGDNVTEIVREMASQLQKAIAQYAG